MTQKRFISRWLIVLLTLCWSMTSLQAQKFEQGKLYHIVSALKGQVVDFGKEGPIRPHKSKTTTTPTNTLRSTSSLVRGA